MKKIFLVALSLALISPTFAFAHERHTYRIGNKTYNIVIGSLNEPIVVDDKTGLDLRVAENATPVEGLETALQVEMIAGDVRKTVELSPAFGQSGSYKTLFYPTVPTTFTYRLFGTINNTPVDLSFTCSAGGHGLTEDENTPVEISPGVTRISKAGSFGCAEAKADFGFPEASKASLNTPSAKAVTTSNIMGGAALVLSLLALSQIWRRK